MLKNQSNSTAPGPKPPAWASPEPPSVKDIKRATTYNAKELGEHITDTSQENTVQPGFLSPNGDMDKKNEERREGQKKIKEKARNERNFSNKKVKKKQREKSNNKENAKKIAKAQAIERKKESNIRVKNSAEQRKAAEEINKAQNALKKIGPMDNHAIPDALSKMQENKTRIDALNTPVSLEAPNLSAKEKAIIQDSKEIEKKAVQESKRRLLPPSDKLQQNLEKLGSHSTIPNGQGHSQSLGLGG